MLLPRRPRGGDHLERDAQMTHPGQTMARGHPGRLGQLGLGRRSRACPLLHSVPPCNAWLRSRVRRAKSNDGTKVDVNIRATESSEAALNGNPGPLAAANVVEVTLDQVPAASSGGDGARTHEPLDCQSSALPTELRPRGGVHPTTSLVRAMWDHVRPALPSCSVGRLQPSCSRRASGPPCRGSRSQPGRLPPDPLGG